MHEIWKDIDGYDGVYQISNTGLVKSFNLSNKHFNTTEHLLKPFLANNGYYQVTLYGKDKKRKKFLVHKLVAMHFIPNPNNYPCVNHKDENRLNNNVENLEWCTYLYNNTYGTSPIRKQEASTEHSVEQYTLSGHWLATYLSCGTIEKLFGYGVSAIRNCCVNNSNTAYGYIWKYVENSSHHLD